jgi:hypothetical protein
MLKQGDLVDVYRQLNPNPSATDFTWQGYANPKLPCCGMRVDHLLMSSLLLSDPTSLIRADRGDDRYGSDHHPLLLEFSVNTDVAKVGALPPPPAGPRTVTEPGVGDRNNMTWDSIRSCSEVCADLRAALGSCVYGPDDTDVDIDELEASIDNMTTAEVRAQFSTDAVPLDQNIDFSPALVAEVMAANCAPAVKQLLKDVSDHVFDTAHGGNLSRMGLNKEIQRRIADGCSSSLTEHPDDAKLSAIISKMGYDNGAPPPTATCDERMAAATLAQVYLAFGDLISWLEDRTQEAYTCTFPEPGINNFADPDACVCRPVMVKLPVQGPTIDTAGDDDYPRVWRMAFYAESFTEAGLIEELRTCAEKRQGIYVYTGDPSDATNQLRHSVPAQYYRCWVADERTVHVVDGIYLQTKRLYTDAGGAYSPNPAQMGPQETVPDGDWNTAVESAQYTTGEVVPWAGPTCSVERKDGTVYSQQGVAYAVFGNGGSEDSDEPTYMTVRFTALDSDLEIAGQNVSSNMGLDEVNFARAQVNKVTYEAESDVKNWQVQTRCASLRRY